jgi:hypothetical protein
MMRATRPRLIAYRDPTDKLERDLNRYVRRSHVHRAVRRSHHALMRYRSAAASLDGWSAIAASVALEAAFQIGRRRGYFDPRATLSALFDVSSPETHR